MKRLYLMAMLMLMAMITLARAESMLDTKPVARDQLKLTQIWTPDPEQRRNLGNARRRR
jgi:hypothetical protein